MKTVLHMHALLCLFLFAFTTTTTLANVVVDMDGEPLMNGGGPYYILPVSRGKGGGLELAKTGSETCPLTVVQARSELSNGLPARFSSPFKIGIISSSLYLNIEFIPEKPSTCLPWPSHWKVTKGSTTGPPFVKISRPERLVGPFKIQEHGKDYKLVYCADSNDDCEDLGIDIDDEGNRLLVVKEGHPLIVEFKKAYEDSARMSIV